VKPIAALILLLASLALAGCSNSSAAAETYAAAQAPPSSLVFNGWFTSDKSAKWCGPLHEGMLFTWFTPVTTAWNATEYKQLISLQKTNGVEFIGYYYSATTTKSATPPSAEQAFPERAIPRSRVNSSWILKDRNGIPVTWPDDKTRYYLDIGLSKVQDAILKRAIANARNLGANVLFLDNWVYKMGAPKDQQQQVWSDKCLAFLKRARQLTFQNGLKLVVNQASPVESWVEFAPYLDGIAYEMAAHPNRLKSPALYENELASYEKVMAMGKTVFLYTGMLTHQGQPWDPDGRKVAATAMLVMPANQPQWGGIYMTNPNYENWPEGGWVFWAKLLGPPLGTRKWESDSVKRNFEHGSITVTTGENPHFNISINY